MEAAQRGDGEAFGVLYERHAAMIHGILLARVAWQDVDDLVQDVFLTAWSRISTLKDPEAFGGWLGQIARNRAVDHHRSRRPTEPMTVEPAEPPPPLAEALAAMQEIRRLPEAYRETLMLRLVEGMTGPEIASLCGLTPGSVRVNLHRGMALLRKRLGDPSPKKTDE